MGLQHEFLANNKWVEAIDTTAAGTTDVNGATVDMTGFDSLTAAVRMGAITANAVTNVHLEHSHDGTTWANITGATRTVADNDDNEWVLIEKVKMERRYGRVVVDRGTENAAITIGVYILTQGHHVPVTHGGDIETVRVV